MTNLILFVNALLSYLFVVVIITILVVVACVLGVKWKKHSEIKDKGRTQE